MADAGLEGSPNAGSSQELEREFANPVEESVVWSIYEVCSQPCCSCLGIVWGVWVTWRRGRHKKCCTINPVSSGGCCSAGPPNRQLRNNGTSRKFMVLTKNAKSSFCLFCAYMGVCLHRYSLPLYHRHRPCHFWESAIISGRMPSFHNAFWLSVGRPGCMYDGHLTTECCLDPAHSISQLISLSSGLIRGL